MQKFSKDILRISVYVFLLNFIWEISQMPLYQKHTQGLGNFIYVHIKASLGDMLIFLLIYIPGVFLFKNRRWFLKANISKYFAASSFGFVLAVAVEKYALSTGRWAYNDLMPIIPFFKVGLSPIAQMIILPVATLFLLNKKYNQ